MALRPLKVFISIPVGRYMKLGYRPLGSGSPFTYVSPDPFYNQVPYLTPPVNDLLQWEVEVTTLCGTCPGGVESPPVYLISEP